MFLISAAVRVKKNANKKSINVPVIRSFGGSRKRPFVTVYSDFLLSPQ